MMTIEEKLRERSDSVCELCAATDNLKIYEVPESPVEAEEASILICNTCSEQIEDPEKTEPNHWRCLNDAMWSTVPAVQVMAWRMLDRMKAEGWPQDLLDIMYMDDELKAWATAAKKEAENKVIHKDSNGAVIEAGDSVVLIKDLNVKGSSLVAKRGTAVRRVSLVHDNAEQIEGKVEGQQIVILTRFVKKV